MKKQDKQAIIFGLMVHIEDIRKQIELDQERMKETSNESIFGFQLGCIRTNESEKEWLETFLSSMQELLLRR